MITTHKNYWLEFKDLVTNISYEDKKIVFISLFATSILVSNLLAIKIFDLGFWDMTVDCGNLLFPLGYLLSDVITEVYGEKTAQKTILLGFASNLLLVIFTSIAVQMPYPNYWTGQSSYAFVFNYSPRVLLGSSLGYICGQLVNARLMVVIKKLNNHLLARTIGSSLGGETVDTLIFTTIAFIFTAPLKELLIMMVVSYTMKILWEVCLQPVTFKAIEWARPST